MYRAGRIYLWNKTKDDKLIIGIIPKLVLYQFFKEHVWKNDNNFFKGNDFRTCFVRANSNWTGNPKDEDVIRIIEESINRGKFQEGFDLNFPIWPPLLKKLSIKIREFRGGEPAGEVFDKGDLAISIEKHKAGLRGLLDIIRKRKNSLEGSNDFEKEIAEFFSDLGNLYKDEIEKNLNFINQPVFFLIVHLHPSRPRKL